MHALLALLADRRYHSGASLGGALGLSRAAVWKQVHGLQQAGVAIESVHGKGYRLLTPIEPLDEAAIRRYLPATSADRVVLDIRESVDSTNAVLMERDAGREPGRVPVCLAETQRAGRGRRGRRWQTPYGATLALSLQWRFNVDAGGLAGLSLATGVAVVQALEGLDIEGIQLKWPNDLVCGGAKLGGILIELSGDAAGPCTVVLGIGLNISASAAADTAMAGLDRAWTDLLSVHGELSRNRLAAAIIGALLDMLPRFEAQGFAPYREAYTAHDALWDRLVEVSRERHPLTGRARGVDPHGGLLVESDGASHTITSGEVSVRAAP